MVKQIPMYEDSAGNVHRTEYEAYRSDLILWFIGTGAMNEASAKALVDHVTAGGGKRAEELANMFKVFQGTMPAPVEPARWSADDERAYLAASARQ